MRSISKLSLPQELGAGSAVDVKENSIHIQRNVVKVGGEKVFAKEPKTESGNRYVYFSDSLANLLKITNCQQI